VSGSARGAESAAQASPAPRGVNPSDIDTRIDLIFKYVDLGDVDLGNGTSERSDMSVTTLKYDYKLGGAWGLNFEFPAYSALNGSVKAEGVGDLFSRVRYITQAGRWSVGGSAEMVFPTAAADALGTGKYQANIAALAVRPVSASYISAFVIKENSSVWGDGDRDDIRTTELRTLAIFILPKAFSLIGDYKFNLSHVGRNDRWHTGEVSLGKQFTLNWAGGVAVQKNWGDRPDDGSISASVKYFF
jgi:hypothetical protein